jgi:hypothetical protein
MFWISQAFQVLKRLTYIAVALPVADIGTGHKRNEIDDIIVFIGH